jgi:hypothetical protein
MAAILAKIMPVINSCNVRGKRFMTLEIRFKLCSPEVLIKKGAPLLSKVVTQA